MRNLTFLARAGAVLALVASAGTAQLAGTYAIDNSAPTGGGNYNSFIDAATALTSSGVSGPTTFVVSPGIASYAGFALGVIPGTSATNLVSFVAAPGGPRPILSGPAATFAQTVRFGTSTSTSTLNTGPSFVVFDGFEITGAPSGAAFLALGCHQVTVRNCVAHSSGSGIGLTATTSSVIENCEVYGTATTPGAGGSGLYSGGIWAYQYCDGNAIQRNWIHDCAANGIFVGSSTTGAAAPTNHVVINNFIVNCGTQPSASYAAGIALRRATGAIVANNSVSMPAGSLFAAIYLMGGSSSTPLLAAEVSNNIAQHNGNRTCFQTEYAGQAAPVQDHNLFDPAGGGPVAGIGTSSSSTTTPYADLAAWQAASGADLNSVEDEAGFLSAVDLHITPASGAFNAGSLVAAVADDIDMQIRPFGAINDIGADEVPDVGIFASFRASAVSGNAPLTVTFTDRSFSSDPNGIITWAWDFDGNGTTDSTAQNPSFTYLVPGTYTVALTVTDLVNGTNTRVRMNYIAVAQYLLTVLTSGGGAGDLTIVPVPHYGAGAATTGFLFFTFATQLPVGQGPFFGISPDFFTWTIVMSPPTAGDILHWVYVPGLFPDVPIVLPPGSAVALAGQTLDFLQIDLGPTFQIVNVSNIARASF